MLKEVVIIGGGVSGLSSAYFIKKYLAVHRAPPTVNITVLEQDYRTGGKIATEMVGDFTVEKGPDSVTTSNEIFMRLCRDLDIDKHMIAPEQSASKVSVLLGKQLRSLPEGLAMMLPNSITSMVLSDLLTPIGKSRAALEILMPRGSGADESVASFVKRRFGREVYERLAEPLLCGIHAGNPEFTSLRCAFPYLAEFEHNFRSILLSGKKHWHRTTNATANTPPRPQLISLDSGMEDLPNALVKALGSANILTHKGVKSVVPTGTRNGNHLINLFNGETMSADAIIIATPAYSSAKMLSGSDERLAGLLTAIQYRSVVTVSLAYKNSDIISYPNGSGVLIPRIEGMRLGAITWSSLKWSSRAPSRTLLARCYFNDAYYNDTINLDDRAIIDMANDSLSALLGIIGKPIMSRVYRWPMGMPQYTIGHSQRVDAIMSKLKEHKGIFVTGAWINGVGVPNCVSNSSKVATEVVDYICKSA